MRILSKLVLVYVLLPFMAIASQVTIVIDDVGFKPSDWELSSLPKEVSFSILPEANFATRYAHEAKLDDRDVLIHMPMESLVPSSDLGNNPLMVNMSESELEWTLEQALASVPNAIGINNHMGSKFTQLRAPMNAFFSVLSRTDLFFVDSRTTPFTRAYELAELNGVTALKRQVFLDHRHDIDYVERQFDRFIEIAQLKGRALAIGHPHPNTLKVLHQRLPELKAMGIELVSISEYLAQKDSYQEAGLANHAASDKPLSAKIN